VLTGSDGAVYAVDAAGRYLWEALRAGCSVDELAGAVAHGKAPLPKLGRTSAGHCEHGGRSAFGSGRARPLRPR
jgi:hypothetical protein